METNISTVQVVLMGLITVFVVLICLIVIIKILGLIMEKVAKKQPAPAAAPAGAGEQVKRPMPGNILSVNVNVGDTVAEGQVLMILEAMKMENEIMAPKAGKVTSVNVQKGATVESGTLLCVVG